MSSYAKVQLIGNLGRGPEARFMSSGAINVSFSIAVSRKYGEKENTTWYKVTAWGKLAELLDRMTQEGNLAKGKQVFVSGRIEQSEYTTQDGAVRTSLDVNADDVILLTRGDVKPIAASQEGSFDQEEFPF